MNIVTIDEFRHKQNHENLIRDLAQDEGYKLFLKHSENIMARFFDMPDDDYINFNYHVISVFLGCYFYKISSIFKNDIYKKQFNDKQLFNLKKNLLAIVNRCEI